MHATGGALLILGLALVSLAAAVLVYMGRPRHTTNRLLAAALFFQAIAESLVAVGLLHGVAERVGGTALGASVVFFVAALAWIMLYLLFLGTLKTPLSRPLGSFAGRTVAITYWASITTWVILRPRDLLAMEDAPPSLTLLLPLLFVSIYGLLIAIQMFRRAAPRGLERRQASAYLLAFGVRDAALLVFAATAIMAVFVPPAPWATAIAPRIPSIANTFSAVFLAYGILSTQLLDIDLKVKWGVRRGTVLAIFVAVFIATTEIVSEVVTERAGLWAGIVATTLLVLALGPLQRVADHVADRTLPDVHDTAEYRASRGREIYRAAVLSALQDGQVTERERDVLATLADELGLTSREALSMERALRAPKPAQGGP